MMKTGVNLIAVAALFSFYVAGCATSISSDLLLKKMLEKPAPWVIDVRSQGEYDADHIPGAVHISFYSIGSGLERNGISSKDTIVLYCEHGPRAGVAGLLLYFSGYENYYSLSGHMKAWRDSGMPVEKISR